MELKKKNKIIRILVSIQLILVGIASPFLFIGLMYGVFGSNPHPAAVMLLSLAAIIIFSIFVLFKPKFFWLIITSYVVFFGAAEVDKRFWKYENRSLCEKIKSDPYCKEIGYGYECKEPSPLGNMTTAKSICR